MSFVTHLTGIGSGHHYPADQLMNLDPIDGRPVRMELDLEALCAAYPNHSWYQPQRKDMWRFGGLLPLDINCAQDQASVVCLGEGHTPLLDASRLPMARKSNLRLFIKDEGHPHAGFGENPTHLALHRRRVD